MKKAFSLIELLVVIAIVGIIASLLISMISGGYTLSKTTLCKNNQRQLVFAATSYRNDNGKHPPAVVSMSVHWDNESILWQYLDKVEEKLICSEHFDESYSTTGYNYNAMLGDEYQIGSGITIEGISVSNCSHPANCAMFGDGHNNKFMRATLSNISIRCGGRQSFRHSGATVIGWLDGHVSVQPTMYNNGCDVVPNVGFLSEDNNAYDPRMLNLD
ncbi:MAG: type II secretion system protein [Phycisphaerales bacterium]|nr:type II secretion system protein [Phycisphaerales bacterium]